MESISTSRSAINPASNRSSSLSRRSSDVATVRQTDTSVASIKFTGCIDDEAGFESDSSCEQQLEIISDPQRPEPSAFLDLRHRAISEPQGPQPSANSDLQHGAILDQKFDSMALASHSLANKNSRSKLETTAGINSLGILNVPDGTGSEVKTQDGTGFMGTDGEGRSARTTRGSGERGGEKNVHSVDVTSAVASIKFVGLINDGTDSESEEEDDGIDAALPEASSPTPSVFDDQISRGVIPPRDDKNQTGRVPPGSGGVRLVSSASAGQIAPLTTVTEDHFALPEDECLPHTIPELESAIERCKELVKRAVPRSDRAKDLTRQLIQLRLRLVESREEPPHADLKKAMGHPFEERFSLVGGGAKGYCECCNGVIINMLQVSLKCVVCGFCCHKKCVNLINRTCAGVKVAENPVYILDICPERGLHTQNYACAECRSAIGFQTGMREPRQCDYNGQFYCDHCHWNDSSVVLSRVLTNWDFRPRKVCRASKQLLKLMTQRAIIRVQDINPLLFSYLDELNQVKKLREEILIMKKYFLQCSDALKSRMLLQLQNRQHFVENSDMYSVQDLIDVANDVLLPELVKVHSSFAQHIKTDCESCRSKGYACLLCDDDEVLFPFDSSAFVCPYCANVVHRHCYIQRRQLCPKCQHQVMTSSGSW